MDKVCSLRRLAATQYKRGGVLMMMTSAADVACHMIWWAEGAASHLNLSSNKRGIVDDFGGDALASADASEPLPHEQEDTGLGGNKRGKLYRYKEIFFGAKRQWSDIYIFSRVELTSTYRDQLLVSHQKETTLQHFTTFYNILQHVTTFTTFYNIHTTFTTFYNILQHYPWRCVVSPEGR